MQLRQSRKAGKASSLFEAGKFRRALRGYSSLYRKDPSDELFLSRALSCRESLGQSITDFLARLKETRNESVQSSDRVSAIYLGTADWLRNRDADDDLELREFLTRFAADLRVHRSNDDSSNEDSSNNAAAELGKAILQTIELKDAERQMAAINWLNSDANLPSLVPQNVLVDRAIRWLIDTMTERSLEQIRDLVARLPRQGAFDQWPWCPFLALIRLEKNPVEIDWIPDVTQMGCSEPARYSRLWNSLWDAGNRDQLLQRYASHVATNCDDDGTALFMSNRAIARSGELKDVATNLKPARMKFVIQAVATRLHTAPVFDVTLLREAIDLCERLAETNFPSAPIAKLGTKVFESIARTGEPELQDVAMLVRDARLYKHTPERIAQTRLETWFRSAAESLGDKELGELVCVLLADKPVDSDAWPDMKWFLLAQFLKHRPKFYVGELIPDCEQLLNASADQYRSLWRFLSHHQRYDSLNELAQHVERVNQESDEPVADWCAAGCGRTDLISHSLEKEELTQSLIDLLYWAMPCEQSESLVRQKTLLAFMDSLHIDQLDVEAVKPAMKAFVNALGECANFDEEADVFDASLIRSMIDDRIVGTQFAAWVFQRLNAVKPAEHSNLRSMLPRKITSDQQLAWRLFDSVDQAGIDVISLQAMPALDLLPRATPVQYRNLWRHLAEHGHEELLASTAHDIADRFADTAAFIVYLQTRGTDDVEQNIVETQEFLARPEVQSLWPRQLDTFARDALRCLVAGISTKDQAIPVLARLEFLPLANPAARAIEYRKLITNSDEYESMDSLPEKIDFDRTWSLHRLVVRKRNGIAHYDSMLQETMAEIPSIESLALPEIALACRSLEELEAIDLLEDYSAHALKQVSDWRFFLFFAIAAIRREQVSEAIAAAERGLVLSDLAGTPEPRFIRILFAAPDAKEVCDRMEKRLSSNSKEVRMLRAMIKAHAGEAGAARETFALILQELDRQNDLTVKRERVLFDFVRQECDSETCENLLGGLDVELLPVDWAIIHGQALLSGGRLVDAQRYCQRVLKASPNHIDALLFSARLQIASFYTRDALATCQLILKNNPGNLRAQSLFIGASRLAGKSQKDMVRDIESWADERSESERREYFICRLLELSFPTRAFVESWNWYSSDRESAADLVGKSLYAMGEYGLAKTFLTDQNAQSYFDVISDLELIAEQNSIPPEQAFELCNELAEKIVAGKEPEEIALTGGQSLAVSSTNRLAVPAVLMQLIVKHAKVRCKMQSSSEGNENRSGPVVLVSASLGAGGAERQVVYTARGLKKKLAHRRDLIVLCANLGEQHGRGFFRSELQRDRIKVALAETFIDPTKPMDGREDFESILKHWPEGKGGKLVANYFAAFNELKPRVVYASQDETNIFAGFAALLAGVSRIVISGRSLNPRYFTESSAWLKLAYQILLKDERVVLVNNSRAGADDYCKWLEIPAGTARTIHNGFDFDAIDAKLKLRTPAQIREDFGIPADAIVVGAVLRMHKVKRPEYCLAVITELQKSFPNMYGLIIGDGPLRQAIEATAGASPFADRLRFPGVLSPVEPAMAAMDVLLLGSEVEGLPNVLVEAQATGTFVASTDVGGAIETFAPEQTGIVIPMDNIREAASRIEKWLRDPTLLESASNKARKHVREKFSINRMIQNTIDVLQISDKVDGNDLDDDSRVETTASAGDEECQAG